MRVGAEIRAGEQALLGGTGVQPEHSTAGPGVIGLWACAHNTSVDNYLQDRDNGIFRRSISLEVTRRVSVPASVLLAAVLGLAGVAVLTVGPAVGAD